MTGAEKRATKLATRALSAFEQAAADLHEAAHIQATEAQLRRDRARSLEVQAGFLSDEATSLDMQASETRRRATKLSDFLA